MIHDCIYQFLRLFYHSRFKPQQLEMTVSQMSAPVLDLVLVLPLIFRLYKDLSRFSNETKLKVQSKPEIKEQSSLWKNLESVSRSSPKISNKSFFYSHLFTYHQLHFLPMEKLDFQLFIKQRRTEKQLFLR